MAKTQILDYYIHLTDKATVDRYNDELAAGVPTASPGGVGSPLLFIPATNQHAILRAPDAAAVEFSAPKIVPPTVHTAPSTQSPWFIAGTNNFPTNVATFTRKSGGWFGIPSLFGQTTKFYWAGHFVYSPPASPTDGSGVVVSQASPIPARRWINGGSEFPGTSETAVGGEGQTATGTPSPEAARFEDASFGFALREGDASVMRINHAVPFTPGMHTAWDRSRFLLRKIPSVTTPIWESRHAATGGAGWRIYVNTSGELEFYISTGAGESSKTLVATGGVVTLNRWYRFDCLSFFKAQVTPSLFVGHLETYLDGARIAQLSQTPTGVAGNVKYDGSAIGKTHSLTSTLEANFEDWINADIPANMNTVNADWSSGTAYAIGDIVNWDPATPTGFGWRQPSNVRGKAYRALTAHTNRQPDLNPSDWTVLGDSPDWLLGSRVVLVRPTGDGSDRSVDWIGDWRLALQRPVDGTGSGELTSTVASARFSVTSDAAQAMQIAGVKGIGSFIVAAHSQRAVTAGAQGQLGYRLNGAAPVMATVIDGSGARAWAQKDPAAAGLPAVIHNLAAGSTAPFALTSLDLILDRDTGAGTARIGSLHALVELLGFFGAEDVPPGTIDPPTFPRLRTGIHNRWYSRSPWAQNTSRAHAPVVIVGGLYTGNDTAQHLTFRLPPHFLWIRRVTGTGDLGARWFAAHFNAHVDLQEGSRPAAIVQALIDPAFVPGGGEDDQAQQYIVRIVGNDAQVNASAVSYQYIAICDPAARFLLTGSLNHDDAAAGLPAIDVLPDAEWTPETGFFWPETRSTTVTDRLGFKGIGHTSDAATELPATLDSNYATFSQGQITIRAGLFNAAEVQNVAYALFRRNDGNSDPNAGKALSLLSYTGDGAGSRVLTFTPAPGLRPLFAIVVGNASYFRDPSHASTSSTNLADGTETATGITAGGLDSITIGSALNTLNQLYNVLVVWGSATAGNNGWSINGEFVPVEPDSVKPTAWSEPVEKTFTFGAGGGAAPSQAAQPDLDTTATASSTDLGGVGPLGSSAVSTGGLAGGQVCEFYTRSLLNQALQRIGVSKVIVNAATDLTEEAVQARTFVLEDVNQVLRDFPWAFATRYSTLVKVGGTASVPVNEDWQYSYRAPSGMMFPRRIAKKGNSRAFDPNPIPFREASDSTGHLLFCNEDTTATLPLVLEWTARITCPAFYGDAMFRDALTWRFASSFAACIAKDKEKHEFALQMYRAVLHSAQVDAMNAQQTQPAELAEGDADWLRDRN